MIRRLYDNYKEIIINTIIAALIGIIIGAIDAVFGRVLLRLIKIREDSMMIFIPFLPLAGVLIMLLFRKISKTSMKGMTLVFETGLGDSDKIPKALIPLAIISTWITHLFGGSAGREGVAVQLGATVAHTIGRKLNLPNNSRTLLIAGMAAGFAGLFQTPLAATFFAMEVLVTGTLIYEALLPALAASFVASYTSHMLGLEKFSVPIEDTLDVSANMIMKLIVIGIVFGIVGGTFAHLLGFSKKWFAKRIDDPIKRIFILGCGIAFLLIVLHNGRYSSLGTNLISLSFSGGEIYIYDWVIKIILTILTLSAGYQGGEVTPLFSIGASLGIALASLLGIPPVITAALGYAAVFGSATNTLLAPILIGIEVFGPDNSLYFIVVCAIAYVFNGNRTIYGAQKKYSYLASIEED